MLSRHPRFYTVLLLAVLVGSGCFVVQAQEKDSKSDKSDKSAQTQRMDSRTR